MKNKLNDKKRKIDIAKEVANEVLNIYKSYQDSTGGLEMGVLYFVRFENVEELVPFEKFDYENIKSKIESIDTTNKEVIIISANTNLFL